MDTMDFLKGVPLFSLLKEEELEFIAKRAITEFHAAGKIIFIENSVADALFIVSSGTAAVFSEDETGQEISLAQFRSGDYFGEHAYLNYFIRTASTKAISDTYLIRINFNDIEPFFMRYPQLQHAFENVAIEHALANFKTQLAFVTQDMQNILGYVEQATQADEVETPEDPNVIQKIFQLFSKNEKTTTTSTPAAPVSLRSYKKGEFIFLKGEPFDNVYFVVSGKVSYALSQQTEMQLLIDKNHFFGELGLLQNQARIASAMAATNVRLMVIPRNVLITAFQQKKSGNALPLTFNNLQVLTPEKIIISQFSKTVENLTTLISFVQNHSGKITVCAKMLDKPIFTFKQLDEVADECLSYNDNQYTHRRILLKNNRVIGIENLGHWPEAITLSFALIHDYPLPEIDKKLFLETGQISSQQWHIDSIAADCLCPCLQISGNTILALFQQKNASLAEILKLTKACTLCGMCEPGIQQLLHAKQIRR
jgi:CRP-like cAMP-binding protein/bacterioferritin-associated ferredoxin